MTFVTKIKRRINPPLYVQLDQHPSLLPFIQTKPRQYYLAGGKVRLAKTPIHNLRVGGVFYAVHIHGAMVFTHVHFATHVFSVHNRDGERYIFTILKVQGRNLISSPAFRVLFSPINITW